MSILKRICICAAFLAGLAASLEAAPPKVPDSIVFAGETIRFDDMNMYERMDRELVTFTYMHTNSTLMLKRPFHRSKVIQGSGRR